MRGRPPRSPHKATITAAALALACLVAGCGNDNSSGSASAATVVLDAGLKAQSHGRLVEAVAEYKSVLKLDPHNVYAMYNLGVIAQQSNQIDEAANEYQRALAARPEYVPALYNLATIEATPAPKSAVALYKKVINLQPHDAKAHLNLGLLLVQMGRATQGKAQIAQALRLDPALRPTHDDPGSTTTSVPPLPAGH